MDLNDNKLDAKKENEGVWVSMDTETEVLVARWLNTKHRKFIQKAMQPYTKMNRLGKVSDDVAEKIEVEAIAECVLLDWKGLKNNGKELKYSKAEAIKILANKQLSWFYDFVRDTANDIEMYNEEIIAEGEDNIKKLSAG